MIMGRVLDTLYGSNLDSDTSRDVFKVASDVCQMEHQISEAQRRFPPGIRAVQLSDLISDARPPFRTLRFRLIVTLRYHNLRILTHRPLLQRYLGILRSQSEDGQQLSSLHQVGINSLHICIQSARTVIELLAHTTKSKGEDKGLQGAWWFSLYYSKTALGDSPKYPEWIKLTPGLCPSLQRGPGHLLGPPDPGARRRPPLALLSRQL